MVVGRSVGLRRITIDRYGRIVAELFVDETNMELAMIASGYAGIDWRYADQCSAASRTTKLRRFIRLLLLCLPLLSFFWQLKNHAATTICHQHKQQLVSRIQCSARREMDGSVSSASFYLLQLHQPVTLFMLFRPHME